MLDDFSREQFEEVSNLVEENSSVIEVIVGEIVDRYTRELDDFVFKIKAGLEDKEHPVTTSELSNICMRLSTYIYFASSMSEQLGIKDDISKALYKEVYNNNRNLLDRGTVADKNTQAELSSRKEYLVNVIYSRSFKIVKSKVESAQELLSSCKKVLTLRISESELTRISPNI
mgnify:CR=1 FL=1